MFLQEVSDSQWKHKGYTLNVNKLKFRIECVHACNIYLKKTSKDPRNNVYIMLKMHEVPKIVQSSHLDCTWDCQLYVNE